jgi:uncharacterized lipoprotein YbaY
VTLLGANSIKEKIKNSSIEFLGFSSFQDLEQKMKTIQGTINSLDSQTLPVGSVILIYVNNSNSQVLGNQSMQKIEKFPIEYKCDVSNSAFTEEQELSVSVCIENGESVVFVSDEKKFKTTDNLDKIDVQVKTNVQ